MATRIRDEDAELVDAHFEVEEAGVGFDVCVQRRSGQFRKDGTRNEDYARGLELLLARLGALNATMTMAWLDSQNAAPLRGAARELTSTGLVFPLALTPTLHAASLGSSLGKALADTLRAPGARGSGNATKSLRMHVELLDPFSVEGLEHRLSRPMTTYQTPSPPQTDMAGAPPPMRYGETETPERALSHAGRGQGFSRDAAFNRAVELRAMLVARAQLRAEGWSVTDTSHNRPYDFRCDQPGQPPLYVEVKGTTGAGERVIVTANEVQHAQDPSHRVRLMIVSGVEVTREQGKPVAHGGVLTSVDGWTPAPEQLTPLAYYFEVPRAPEDP